MFSLPHWLYPLGGFLGAFYGAMGLVIARRAHRPTCRICAHRAYCPVRRRSLWNRNIKRCYDQI